MARSDKDPRVVEILATFDRVAASPTRCPSDICSYMVSVAGTVIDRFTIPGGWSDEAIRAVLLVFVLHAPDEDIEEMLGSARGEAAMLDRFEHDLERERGASAVLS